MPEALAAIALGSNLPSGFGDRAANLKEAVRRLGELGEVAAVSGFLDTAPVGYTEQPRFLNGCCLLRTSLLPLPLLQALLAVELAMGRTRTDVPAKGPRVIDLDLLLYDDVVLVAEGLMLPHPALAERRFVLEPLAELAPAWRHPVHGVTIGELLQRLG